MVSLPYRNLDRSTLRVFEGVIVNPAATPDLPARTQVTAWAGPREQFMTSGRDTGEPSFEVEHPEAASSFHRRVEHFTYGARIVHDARSGRPHWTQGWRASVEAERYDKAI